MDWENRMERILIVEDDYIIRKSIVNLLGNDYIIFEADNAAVGQAVLMRENIAVCLLDINLPDANGYHLCKTIRSYSTVPIIMITVNDSEENIIEGLESGADDYMVKPFSNAELKGRIMAQIRRSRFQLRKEQRIIQRGYYFLHLDNYSLEKNGVKIDITKSEFKLLKILMENTGCLLTREQLLEALWDIDSNFVENNTLTVLVSRLRRKLKAPDGIDPIETVSRIGYRWKDGPVNE